METYYRLRASGIFTIGSLTIIISMGVDNIDLALGLILAI